MERLGQEQVPRDVRQLIAIRLESNQDAFDPFQNYSDYRRCDPRDPADDLLLVLLLRQGGIRPPVGGDDAVDRAGHAEHARRVFREHRAIRRHGGQRGDRLAGQRRAGGVRRRGQPGWAGETDAGADRPARRLPGGALRPDPEDLRERRQPHARHQHLLLLHQPGDQRDGARLLLFPRRKGGLCRPGASGRAHPRSERH